MVPTANPQMSWIWLFVFSTPPTKRRANDSQHQTCPSIPAWTKPPFQLQLRAMPHWEQANTYISWCHPREPAWPPLLHPCSHPPGHLPNDGNTVDYLILETDHRITSILDALEVVSVRYRNSSCNHIFMNFIYNLSVSYEDALELFPASSSAMASICGNSTF